jgi:Domain of unknown function (DUF222)
MFGTMTDPVYGEQDFAAELAALEAAGVLVAPADRECPDGPVEVLAVDWFDETPQRMSKVDALEWEVWAGVEQDDAERAMLLDRAPAWVFLPPGGELAAALEGVRPQAESPVALIEVMKAASRMVSWAESVKMSAMASFERQRQAQAADIPRPSELDARGRPTDPERSRAAEVACALRLAPDTVRRHIDTALRLTGVLSATHSALRCGALTLSKAIAICDATRELDPVQARAVEAHVLKRAAGQTHPNLLKSLARQVAKYNTKEKAERHRDAVTKRECRVVPLADGMAGLWVTHTADKIQQMWIVIQAMADLAKRGTPATGQETTAADGSAAGSGEGAGATGGSPATAGSAADTGDGPAADSDTAATAAKTSDSGRDQDTTTTGAEASSDTGTEAGTEAATEAGARTTNATGTETGARTEAGALSTGRGKDTRTADQRRADVAVDLFEFILHNGLDWLGRRLPDQHGRWPHIEVLVAISTLLGLDDDPAELTGYGPIPAEMGRRIAANGTWRRLLTDPVNGTVLEASTTRHDPGKLVSETLLARHPVCAWSGCNRPARECDRDHGIPFAQSGTTTLRDLAPFCEFHHIIKDTPAWGWKAVNNPDGSVTLTAPTGHRYTTEPPARGPIIQTPPTAPEPDDPPPF